MSEPFDTPVADPATPSPAPFNPSDIPEAKADQSVAAMSSPTPAPSPASSPTTEAPMNRAAMDDQSMQQLADLPDTKRMVANAKAMLYDREGFGGKAPQALLASKSQNDPQQWRDGTAAVAGMSAILGLPAETVADNFSQYQNKIEGAMGWDHSPSVGGFANNLTSYFKTQDAREQAIQDLQKTAISDYASFAAKGMSPNPLAAFSKWNEQTGDAFKGMPEDQKIQVFNNVYAPVMKEMATPEGQKAVQLVQALQQNKEADGISEVGADQASAAMSQGKDAPDQPAKIDPIQFIKGIPEEQQNKVLSLASQLMSSTQSDMGNGMKVAGGLGQAFAQGFTSWGAIGHLDDLVEAEKSLKAAKTPEDARKAQDTIDNIKLAQKIKQADQQANMVNPELYGLPSIAYKVSQGVAGMPGSLAPALVPVLGEFAFYKQAQAEDALKLMAQNPNMSAEEAKSRSTIASAAYGITMGRMGAILGEASPGLVNFLAHTAQSTAIMQGAEAERILGRQLQSIVDPSFNPKEQYGQEWFDLLKATPYTFATLAAFGGAIKLMNQGQAPDPNSFGELEKQAGNPRILQYLGLNAETAQRISALPEGERVKALSGEWEKRTEESKQDGVELAKQDSDALNKVTSSPDAPKVEQTPDGKFIVTTKNGDETHPTPFETHEGAQQALQVALTDHVEKTAPTIEDGNDWTTATEDEPSTHTITADTPETTDAPEAKQEGNGPDWQYKDEASQSWWQERDRLQAAYDATAPHTPERQAARQALHDYEDRRFAGGPDADISQRHDANNLTASFFLDEEGNGMQSGNMDGATWSGDEIINSRGERVRQVTLPDGATGFLRLDHTPDHILEHIDANAEPRAEETLPESDKQFPTTKKEVQAQLDERFKRKEQEQERLRVVSEQLPKYLADSGVVGDLASKASDEISSKLNEIAKASEDDRSYSELFQGGKEPPGAEVRDSTDLPPIHGVNVDASSAFQQNGNIVSHLIHSLISREIPSFNIDGAVIRSPKDFATLLMPLRSPFFESVKVAFMDKDNKVIHSQILNVGTVNESVAHPRDFLLALSDAKKKSPEIASAIFAHNHPSGDPTPSAADKNLTERIEKAFKGAGIILKDHIITNGEKGYSFNAGEKFDINAGLAPWESASRSSLKTINSNNALGEYIKNLRQGVAPETAHIIYSNTQFNVTAVERVPNGAVDADAMRNALTAGIGREGPTGVFIDVSGKSGMASDGVIKAAKEVAENALVQINDISTKDVQSYRAEGILQGRPRAYSENGLREEPQDQKPRGEKAKAFFTPDRENGNKVAPALSFKEQAKITAGKVMDAVRDLPKDSDFKREVLKWSARSQGSTNEIERVQRSIEQAIPDKAKREGITNWIEAGGDKSLLRERAAATTDAKLKAGYEAALNFTPEEIALANKAKQTFAVLEARAKKYGIDMGHRENYVPHVFEQEPQPPSGTTPKRLSEFFKFSQTRVFDSYFEGEQIKDKDGNPAPYKAQTKDIAKLIGLYMNDMNNAINSRRFVAELSKGKASDGRPLVSPRGSGKAVEGEHGEETMHLVYPDSAKEGHEDYKTVDQPALHDWSFAGKDDLGANIMVKGDLAVHPEVAKHLSNALGSSAITKWMQTKTENPFLNGGKWVADKILKGQSLAKGTMLSFSPFHQVQEAIHALGHKVNPFTDIPRIDLRDPKQADAAAHGLMIAHDRLSQSLFMEGVGDNNSNLVTMGLRKIGWGLTTEAADKVDAYQHWLFSQYIPGLKYKTYEHILERNMERYKGDIKSGAASEWQVKVLSAKQSNAAYGHLNYTEMGHNPTIRHAMQLALLAPDFLEARSRFVGQAFKGAMGGKVGSEQLQALAFLAATQFVAATIQKVLTNGDPEFDHPFEMRFGNKYYGVRSVPEDIYKLFGNPTGFIGGRISPIFGRFFQEGFFGVNYRGEHTTVGDAITDILSGLVPMPMQALTRQWTASNQANPISWWEQILASAGLQVHRYSPITKIYPLAKAWLKANHPEDQSARGAYPVSKFQQLRYACEDGDQEKISKEIERLKEEYKLTPAKIASAFKTSVNHPFTGSESHDADMVKTFSDDQKEMYHAAIERRKIILQRFNAFKNTTN